LAKSRDELVAEGYRDFHHFGRFHLYTRLLFAVILYIGLLMIVKSILDQDFAQDFRDSFRNDHCRQRSCRKGLGLLILFGFFLTLPIWFKLPLSAYFGSRWGAKLFSRIYRSMDSKPDLAIGPRGVYFPKKLGYGSCHWSDVSKVRCIRSKSNYTGEITTQIFLYGLTPASPSKWSVNPSAKPLILEIPHNWGMNGEAILKSIRYLASGVDFEEIDLTQPQKTERN
jgi:hypothetical protein